MLARRLIFAFVAALMVAVPATVWLGRKVMARPVVPPPIHYAAAARVVAAGEMLKPDDVLLLDWPAADPVPGAFTHREEVVGRAALYPLAPGEPILDRQLAAPGSGPGLAAKIADGMRAIALKSDEVVGVAGFLYPGTRVDVLVTYRDPDPVTSIVLQDVEVLAAGHQTQPDPDGKTASVDVVTLLLTPRDAQKAVLASSQGTIHFVLRNSSDRGAAQDAPVGLAELGSRVPQSAPVVVKAPRAAPPPPKPYTVETMLGTKQSTDSFQ
jgi:pilus assembly protein CpaB